MKLQPINPDEMSHFTPFHNVKERENIFLDLYLYLDPHRTLMGSLLGRDLLTNQPNQRRSIKIVLVEVLDFFLMKYKWERCFKVKGLLAWSLFQYTLRSCFDLRVHLQTFSGSYIYWCNVHNEFCPLVLKRALHVRVFRQINKAVQHQIKDQVNPSISIHTCYMCLLVCWLNCKLITYNGCSTTAHKDN